MSSENKKHSTDYNDFTYLEMGYAGTKHDGEPFFSRNHFGTIQDIPAMRKQKKNIGLYRSAFMYDNMDPYNSSLFGNLFMDFDSEEDLDKAREDLLFVIWKMHLTSGFNLPIEAFHIYFSGKKGFHLLIPWQYLDIQPHPALDRIFRFIAEDLHEACIHQTIDLVIYEKRRLYRMENTIHQGTGLYKIPLQYEEAAKLSMTEIQDLAKTNRYIRYPTPALMPQAAEHYHKYVREYESYVKDRTRFQSKRVSEPLEIVPEYVEKLIAEGPVVGQRNETAAALTSFWKNQGFEREDILAHLLQWNNGSLSERELEITMDSILKRNLNYSMTRLKSLAEGDSGKTTYTKDRIRERGRKG